MRRNRAANRLAKPASSKRRQPGAGQRLGHRRSAPEPRICRTARPCRKSASVPTATACTQARASLRQFNWRLTTSAGAYRPRSKKAEVDANGEARHRDPHCGAREGMRRVEHAVAQQGDADRHRRIQADEADGADEQPGARVKRVSRKVVSARRASGGGNDIDGYIRFSHTWHQPVPVPVKHSVAIAIPPRADGRRRSCRG